MASPHSHHLGVLHAPTSPIFFYLMLLQILIVPIIVNPISFEFNDGFKEGDLNLGGEAQLTRSEIHVTANSMAQIYNNSVGRVTWPQPIRLWDATSQSRTLTDFSTSFSFIIFSDQTFYADGLAFFLADPNLPILTNIRQGCGLGIIDGHNEEQVLLNSSKHRFLAVEFDTWHNSWDPADGNVHVGINVNSIKSLRTRPWSPDIKRKGQVHNCSVKYDSSALKLTVSVSNGNNNRKGGHNSDEIKSLSYKVDLREYLPEKVIIGFSAATGNLFEVHIIQSWSFHSTLEEEEGEEKEEDSNPKPQKIRKILLYIGLGSGIGLSSTFFCVLLRRRMRKGKEYSSKVEGSVAYDIHKMDDEFNKETGPKSFCYNALKSATNDFSESKKLGQGGFGGVYKGYLKELNCHVAIKRVSSNSAQGIKEYSTEVKVISQLRHRNLVQLLGWCHKRNDLLLVYEYMPNGSLDSYLCNGDKPKHTKLTWQVRYNIALGLASALLYLHEEWSQCVLHRDIKASNIMLDSNFNAKLGDFGLARLVSHEKGSRTTLLAGTRGYIAPEYVFTGKIYKESDIYSFGVVLLEMATGRKAVDIIEDKESGTSVISVVEWVWELYGKGIVGEAGDPNLVGEYEEKEMERMLVVGLWCTYPDHTMRPNVREVIKVLKLEVDLPVIPLTMPVPVYLPPSFKAIFSSLEPSFWAKCSGP